MLDSARNPSASRGAAGSRRSRFGTLHPASPRPGRLLRSGLAGAAVFALVATGAGCGTADAANENNSPRRGGTLRVVMAAQPKNLDPQLITHVNESALSRMLTRTLTTLRSEPGQDGSQIVGDLATDTGRPSDNNRVWEFTLKSGVKWEDGTPVTCAHLQYGVERSFSDILGNGPKYARTYLADTEGYVGPFRGGQHLASVTCVDTRTIRYRLKQPVGDFGYTVAMPIFAPVLPEQDKKVTYTERPFATGPYKLEHEAVTEPKWKERKQLVLVRNNFWQASTDQVRRALPDRIIVTWNPDGASITNNIIESQGDWANTISIDRDVAAPFVQQVINDTELSQRAIRGATGAVRYFAINTKRIPEKACREAIYLAFNKRKYRSVLGGATTGDLATTMIGPQLKAHKDFDLYGTRTNPDGNIERARELIAQQAALGKPCPATLALAYPNTQDLKKLVSTIVEAYARVGIQIDRKPNPEGTAFTTDYAQNPNLPLDLIYAGWVPDWANGSSILPPLFSSKNLEKARQNSKGNQNYGQLESKEIDELMDQALAEPNLDRQYILWGQIDEKIQSQAVTIPVLYTKALRLAGSNVRGGFIHPQNGQPDLAALGLADPKK